MPYLRRGYFVLLALLASAASAQDAPRPWPADPFLPVTAGRIVALPAMEQPAWRAYWEKSQAQFKLLPPRDPVDHSPNTPLLHAPLGASYSMGLRLDASYTWYANEPARLIADRVVTWQTPAGGWSKDGNYTRDRLPSDDHHDSWSVGTFDNDSTISELRYLARVISYDNTVPPARLNTWKESFMRGLDYVFAAQYPNGGYPQIYPLAGGYHDAITLNDDGYIHILQLLRDVGNREPEYTFVPEEVAAKARRSFQLGLDCILAMQLKSPEGRRTVWCQQYDALTLNPCSARNFEPAAECSRESAGVVKFLMSRPAPSPEIIAAVEGAMQWFADRVIHDKYWDRNAPAGADLEDRPGAPDLWARFYEFNTGKPIFGDRDRKIYYSVAQISFERRKGYTWFCPEPAELVPYYFYWQHKIAKPAPVAGVEQQLIDLEQEWIKAEINHDAATLQRILDDQFVNTFGAGKLLDKEGFIKAVTSGDLDPSLSQTLTDRTILVEGNTAVVVGTDTIRGIDQGKAFAHVYRYTVTCIKRHAQWVALAEHMVKVPPPASGP